MTTLSDIYDIIHDRPLFRKTLGALCQSVKRVDERIYEAPGPAEAWAWLTKSVDKPGAVLDDPRARDRAVYRGQSSAAWGLAPSALRLEDSFKKQALDASQHFSDIAQREFEALWSADLICKSSWPPFHPSSGIAAAQHFRLNTTLLDWSAHISVALDFATSKANGEMSALWWFHLSELDPDLIRIILLPPFLERIYIQRGLFTQLPDSQAVEEIEKVARRIVFPSTHHEPSKLIDASRKLQPRLLEPPEPWFEHLKQYCLSEKGAQAFEEDRDPVWRMMRFQHHLDQLKQSVPKPWQYVLDDHGLTTWFGEDGKLHDIQAFFLALGKRSSSNGKVGLDGQVAEIIKKENPELLTWVMRYFNEI